jgi:hypothetical protein
MKTAPRPGYQLVCRNSRLGLDIPRGYLSSPLITVYQRAGRRAGRRPRW